MHIHIYGGHMKRLEYLFKALADPTRLRIVNLLLQGGACVCDLGSVLDLSQPLISRHLAYLRSCGLVQDHREGIRVRYALVLQEDLSATLEKFLRMAFLTDPVFQEDIQRWRLRRASVLNAEREVPDNLVLIGETP
jgi:ArsR family transcriptional regulator, arsenate/arsenite/antimonite-responsive transcriptional repressor